MDTPVDADEIIGEDLKQEIATLLKLKTISHFICLEEKIFIMKIEVI